MSSENGKRPNLGQRIKASVRNAAAGVLRNVADRIEGPKASFEIADLKIEFDVDIDRDTIWATQQKIADLFGVERSVIAKHIQNVLGDNELEDGPATCAKFAQVRTEGTREVTREVEHYSLEMILAVGQRVSSKRAAQFRKWANRILKDYIVHGYALNERRLRDDPEATKSLAEKVREIRFDEKNLYARVRDCVTMVASDYDGTSEQVRSFFARMQDKFHFAACEQTAQQLLLTRADASKARMGMTVHLNSRPTLAEAKVAKNYLNEEELKLQMLAGEAFFVYVENMIARGRTATTAQLLAKIDEVFKFNEMPEFPGYLGPYIKPQVEAHVKKQYELFKARSDQERYNAANRPQS